MWLSPRRYRRLGMPAPTVAVSSNQVREAIGVVLSRHLARMKARSWRPRVGAPSELKPWRPRVLQHHAPRLARRHLSLGQRDASCIHQPGRQRVEDMDSSYWPRPQEFGVSSTADADDGITMLTLHSITLPHPAVFAAIDNTSHLQTGIPRIELHQHAHRTACVLHSYPFDLSRRGVPMIHRLSPSWRARRRRTSAILPAAGANDKNSNLYSAATTRRTKRSAQLHPGETGIRIQPHQRPKSCSDGLEQAPTAQPTCSSVDASRLARARTRPVRAGQNRRRWNRASRRISAHRRLVRLLHPRPGHRL